MKKTIIIYFLLFTPMVFSQSQDEIMISKIYKNSLTKSSCYNWLDTLSNKIGSRLSGSKGAENAVKYSKLALEHLGLDTVFLQEVNVPKWVRGEKESAYFEINNKKLKVDICALGGSISTSKAGLIGNVIEVKSIKEIAILAEKIKGKIVFFNRPMEPENIETFDSYSNCVDQRYVGTVEAAKYGAIATIVRSMNLRLDDFPHTGAMSYGTLESKNYIPAAAISTNSADLLSKSLLKNPNLKFFMKQSCQNMGEVVSYNVVGEIKGLEFPEKIILIGGHLDSWDLADGSHDDGAGVVQSMGILEIFKKIKYKPKNTIRVVLFMNEENGGKGGKKYAEISRVNNLNHIVAIESDSGGFSPRGFSFEIDDIAFKKVLDWKPLFEPYLIHSFTKGYSGSDIQPLMGTKIIKAGLRPDSQRYFDYHHAANDRFEAVNKRELELGMAAMTSLVYLFDNFKY